MQCLCIAVGTVQPQSAQNVEIAKSLCLLHRQVSFSSGKSSDVINICCSNQSFTAITFVRYQSGRTPKSQNLFLRLHHGQVSFSSGKSSDDIVVPIILQHAYLSIDQSFFTKSQEAFQFEKCASSAPCSLYWK